MTAKLIPQFADWQAKRRKWAHDRLKNEMLNLLLSISAPAHAREAMNEAEWSDRLKRWHRGLTQAGELVASSGTALSPARFLETDVWVWLPPRERSRHAELLHADWWESRGMAAKENRAHAALVAAEQSLQACIVALGGGGIAEGFVVALRHFEEQLRALHGALKEYDFGPLWP